MDGVKMTGIGHYVPERVVTNDEITKILLSRRGEHLRHGRISMLDPRAVQFDTSSEWIETRTGIRERRFAARDQATSDVAVLAARHALQMAGLGSHAIDFILVATVTPDHPASPPTASLVQVKLGIPVRAERGSLRSMLAADVSAACSSFVHGLSLGDALIRSGRCKAGLVIGADVMSRIVSWDDRAIFPILGDGAGCVVLERAPMAEDEFGPNSFFAGSDGSFSELIIVPAGGSRELITANAITDPFSASHTLKMAGRRVFKEVVSLVAKEVIPCALAKRGIPRDELNTIDAILFHQANLRMIEPIVEKLGYGGIVYNNIDRFGNTTSAALPLCLSEAVEKEVIKPGNLVLMVAFGGGFTWSTALFRCHNFELLP